MASKGYREKCLNEKPEKCAICGSEEDIQVHHVDGDKTNESIENLMPLCSHHHGQVHGRADGVEDEQVLELIERLDDYSDDGMYNVTCRMGAGMVERVDSAATKRGCSRAEYIRETVRSRIDGEAGVGSNPTEEELIEKELRIEMLEERVDELNDLLRLAIG